MLIFEKMAKIEKSDTPETTIFFFVLSNNFSLFKKNYSISIIYGYKASNLLKN